MLNLFVRSLKVRKRLVTTATLLAALFSVGCDEVKDCVKNALATTGWLHIDGTKGTLNYDITQYASGAQLITVNSKLYALWTETAPYTIYRDAYSSWDVKPTRVAVYNNDPLDPEWKFVDNNVGVYRNTTKGVPELIASGVAFNNKLYVATTERSPDSNHALNLRIAVYNGNDSAPAWSWVDGNGAYGINKANSKDAWAAKFIVFNNKLYLNWLEKNSSNIGQSRVAVYNGNDSAPSWTLVDGNSTTAGLNINPNVHALVTTPIVYNSKLYVYWTENTPTYTQGGINYNGAAQARIAVYNGDDSNPSWSFVDGGNPAYGVNNTDPYKIVMSESGVVVNNKLYLSTVELRTSDNLWVSRLNVYNGNDSNPSWTQLTDNGPLADSRYITMTALNNKIYAAWSDGEQVRVISYSGNDNNPQWNYADGGKGTGLNVDNSRAVALTGLAVFNSQLYCTWNEQGGNEYVRSHIAVKIK